MKAKDMFKGIYSRLVFCAMSFSDIAPTFTDEENYADSQQASSGPGFEPR